MENPRYVLNYFVYPHFATTHDMSAVILQNIDSRGTGDSSRQIIVLIPVILAAYLVRSYHQQLVTTHHKCEDQTTTLVLTQVGLVARRRPHSLNQERLVRKASSHSPGNAVEQVRCIPDPTSRRTSSPPNRNLHEATVALMPRFAEEERCLHHYRTSAPPSIIRRVSARDLPPYTDGF